MSDNTQRDKSELLTAKEREEAEEMKRELLDMKMYESWYTYKDMKEILGVINESKNMANMVVVNDEKEKNIRKELLPSSNSCTRDVMTRTNLTQELLIQDHNDTSRSIHTYRPNRTSPIREETFARGCNVADFQPVVAQSRNSVYRGKNMDGDDVLVKLEDNLNIRDNCAHNINKYISSKAKSSLQDSDVTNSIGMKMDTPHTECERKLDRWQVDPLDSYVGENDVPLREPNRPAVQDNMPFRSCEDARTPEMLEKLLHALNIRLRETAELWRTWHRTTVTKFQWGSPIQVGLANDSWNKKSLTEQNEMERTNKRNSERANKRKSTLVLSSSSDAEQCSNDEDEKIVKKAKIRSQEDTNKVIRFHRDECSVMNGRNDENLTRDDINENLDDIEIDSCEIEPKGNVEERLSPVLLSLYPRRIMPPSVRKNINKKKVYTDVAGTCSLPRNSSNERHRGAISCSMPKEKSNILSDEEILIELEKDNIRDNVETTSSENVEIKPLTVVRSLSRRLKDQCIILERIQLDKEKQIESVKEEARKKQNEERKRREEFHKKQLNEAQRKEKEKEEEERFRDEKSKKWNKVIDMKSRKNINRDAGRLQNLYDENESLQEKDTFEIEDTEIIENHSTNNVNCPICNESFASDQIETHAAECEQYDDITENEREFNSRIKDNAIPMNSNNSEILECNVCSRFKTTSGIDYEDHVNKCLLRHEEQSVHERTSADTNNLLSSPIRCYRPISEQTDSCIDYRKQFLSSNKTQTHSSKKRKR